MCFVLFCISHELLNATPTREEKADDFSSSLLISQFLHPGRAPRVSSFYIRP